MSINTVVPQRSRATIALAFTLAASMLAASPALAGEKEHFYGVAAAVESEPATEYLGEVPFYMKGAAHPAAGKTLGSVETQRTTRGAFRSKEKACRIAFLEAMAELQKQARAKGGDALIDVVSTTKDKETESRDAYRCVAGLTVAHVGLKATIVGRGAEEASQGAASPAP